MTELVAVEVLWNILNLRDMLVLRDIYNAIFIYLLSKEKARPRRIEVLFLGISWPYKKTTICPSLTRNSPGARRFSARAG